MEELRGEVWAFVSLVMCLIDGQVLGDEKELLKWPYREWDYPDFRSKALYQAIAEDLYSKYLKNSQASSTALHEHKVCKELERLRKGQIPWGGRKVSTDSCGIFLVFLPCDGRAGAEAGEADGEQPLPRMAESPWLLAALEGQTPAQMPDLH